MKEKPRKKINIASLDSVPSQRPAIGCLNGQHMGEVPMAETHLKQTTRMAGWKAPMRQTGVGIAL
jgi:hypothetical protein